MENGYSPDEDVMTVSGRWVSFKDLELNNYSIFDIAKALSNQGRFGGHTDEFYSVAQHSVFVSDMCREFGSQVSLQALLHDAHEAYLVDVPSPAKMHLANYRSLEEKLAASVRRFFEVPVELDIEVRKADLRALFVEVEALTDHGGRAWKDSQRIRGELGVESFSIQPPRTPYQAYHEFLNRFFDLTL